MIHLPNTDTVQSMTGTERQQKLHALTSVTKKQIDQHTNTKLLHDEWKSIDFKCVRKPTKRQLSL